MTDPDRSPLSPDALRRAVGRVLEVPMNRALGIEAETVADGAATARMLVGEASRNNVDVLHGGALYAVLDVVAYLAVLTTLNQGENAVTHDLSVSVLRPTHLGATVELQASVRRRGRRIALIDSEATVDGTLIGLARVTKSIVPGDPA